MNALPINTGDIQVIGDHIVGCADSGDARFVASILNGQKVNLILSDVPYGVSYVESKFTKGTTHAPIANDHDQSDREFTAFTTKWLEAIRPHLASKNAAYVFTGDKMLLPFRDGLSAAGYRFGQLLFWLKTSAVMSRLDYAPQTETLVYFWHGAHEFLKSKDRSVIIHPKPVRNTFHPTEKPIPILRRFILNSTRIGDLVYDPFAGSGTTALAAEQTKRRSISIELEPKYCQIIIERLEKLTGKKAVLLSPSRNGQ